LRDKAQEFIQVGHIYAEIEIILAFSKLLLQGITPRVENWNPSQAIGDVFLGVTEYMKVYSQFVKDYGLFISAWADAIKDNSLLKLIRVSCRVTTSSVFTCCRSLISDKLIALF
jgi:hypothetical protein